MEDAYARSVSEVLDFLEVDPAKGLGDSQVARHARLYGKNVLPEEETAVVSFILALVNGETGLVAFFEPSVVLMILAANLAVGVITETNAEKALEGTITVVGRARAVAVGIGAKYGHGQHTGRYVTNRRWQHTGRYVSFNPSWCPAL